ncbi:MAG: FAD-dependent oxidoreductase [Chloroflexi bacterium]|nr:FAD-dependent oxidoreductase [Chloroflexota bacterium]HCU72387.1 FAD-dependent oxidoreductase [Chloroflexota bacterium]|tara:strand:- start:5557 stop:6801 length:1245 start_codon:yes stop_codon:yes gene_type:complete
MQVAIIGAGVSGLIAARELGQQHDITVFDSSDMPGGHIRTLDLRSSNGQTYGVDTGFVVFNTRTYPEFTQVLKTLEVQTQPAEMSFSVRCERSGVEYSGASLNALFAQRRNLLRPKFHQLVIDYLRFNRRAQRLSVDNDSRTLEDYLRDNRFSRIFRDLYLIPMGSAIWSADPTRLTNIPLRTFIQFFRNHGLLGIRGKPDWRSIVGGARSYVDSITEPFRDSIYLQTPIRRIHRTDDHVVVSGDSTGDMTFDHVVLATHSDQALALLQDPTQSEHEVLGAFPYQSNDVVVHTDTTLLPKQARAWAAWNYYIPTESTTKVSTTYNMNRLQRLNSPDTFCVTLNQASVIDPETVCARMTYQHPIFNSSAVAAQARWNDINNKNRTSFCGAYWKYGFHEDGVISGLRAARELMPPR